MTIKRFLRLALTRGRIRVNGMPRNASVTRVYLGHAYSLDLGCVLIRPYYMDGCTLVDWGYKGTTDDVYRLELR